jgi:glycosyltransferase involved in cell wall biosynthesis
MTAYNREFYIAEAIESVLEQDFENFELIIVDDFSTDNTVEIVKSYQKKDTRIQVYVNEKNLGDYPNRNRAVSHAKGDYIMFVDSDDKLYPQTISKILKDISEDENFNFAMSWLHDNTDFLLKGNEALIKHFFEVQFLYMGPGGTFMLRSFFNKVGGYPEIYGPANDMYFNLKICCYTSIHLLPYHFIFYRRHEGQEINNRFSYLYNNYNYMRDALAELPLPFNSNQINWLIKKNKRRFTLHIINYFIKTRNFKKTKQAYKNADFNLKYFLQGIFQKSGSDFR